MKKRVILLLCVVMLMSMALVGCSSNNSGKSEFEIALVIATGSVDDKSFNQGAWEGITKFADETNKTYKYYQATDQSAAAIENAIDLAVLGGAKVVICPGYLFEKPLYAAQEKYPEVTFIMFDGSPTDDSGNVAIAENTSTFTYSEEQAGFLAGYAAVKDGYRKLGFMGGIAVPPVVRFGYGFVQGAEYAAKELGLDAKEVEINYSYLGTFDAAPDITVKASSWYTNGTEVIFACGGSIGNSIMSAAEQANKAVIGVDVDQSVESSSVITSAMKNIAKTAYDELKQFYDGTLVKGNSTILDVTTESVLLPMETSKFTNFTVEDYNKIYGELVNGVVTIYGDTSFKTVTDLPVEKVSVIDLK